MSLKVFLLFCRIPLVLSAVLSVRSVTKIVGLLMTPKTSLFDTWLFWVTTASYSSYLWILESVPIPFSRVSTCSSIILLFKISRDMYWELFWLILRSTFYRSELWIIFSSISLFENYLNAVYGTLPFSFWENIYIGYNFWLLAVS